MIMDLATGSCLLAAAYFFLAGMMGILRFPDALSRLHAVTKADNLGLGLVVLGLALQEDSPWGVAQLGLIWLLALVASATACLLVANRAADEGGSTAGTAVGAAAENRS